MIRLPLAAALLILTAALPADAQLADPDAVDRAAIRALIEATETANNAGDVEAWVALFDDDAVYMPPSTPTISTREGLVEIAEAGFRHDADVDIEPLEIGVTGDWAWARTRVTGTVIVAGSGEVVDVNSRQIVIYRRDEDGRWKIARLIINKPG